VSISGARHASPANETKDPATVEMVAFIALLAYVEQQNDPVLTELWDRFAVAFVAAR